MEKEFISEKKFLQITVCVILVLFLMINWDLKKQEMVYDYIVWGNGDLTRILVHFLSKSKVLWVNSQNKNRSFISIEGTDIKIMNAAPETKIDHVYFPSPDTNDKKIIDAFEILKKFCGERFKNCFYFRFNKPITAEIEYKNSLIKTERIKDITKVYFDDSVRHCKKIIFSDTGNIEELFKYFWVPKLELKMLTFKEEKIDHKKISFSGNTKLDFDLKKTYSVSLFATGSSVNNLKFSEHQNILDKVEDRCFVNVNTKNRFNKNIICISPSVIEPSQHYIRDYLINCIIESQQI